ncbi:MAG: peptide MFS transporter [Pirellulaceae bacterium]
MSETSDTGSAPKQKTFLGHPIGLYVLFFTEMWERFSYYGMRALLVLYMVNFFKWAQEDASKIYKWYTSLVYLTPLLGGFLADRYLGNRMAIIIGAILMAIGHFLMAFEQIGIFYAALGFLIIGNGFFKPNMSVQVGRLYPQNDPRRDGAYTIFYMGINIGAFLSPLVCGALKDAPGMGYHWGFGAAGVGMVLGLLTYMFGLPFVKELPEDAVYEGDDAKATSKSSALSEAEAAKHPSVLGALGKISPMLVYALGVLFIVGAPIGYSMGSVSFDNMIASIIAGGSMFFAGWIISNLDMAIRDRVLAIYALFVFVVFFWAAFEQAGNAMNVWADQTTNRYLTEAAPSPEIYPDEYTSISEQGFMATLGKAFGNIFKMNPVLTTSFQSINAFAIVVFAPIFAWLWLFLARKNINVSIPMKMAMGVFLQGLAFALMIWAAMYESQSSTTALSQLPSSMITKDDGLIHFFDAPDLTADAKEFEEFGSFEVGKHETMIAQGGRMRFKDGQLEIGGVMGANHRDRILRGTVSKDFLMDIRSSQRKRLPRKRFRRRQF